VKTQVGGNAKKAYPADLVEQGAALFRQDCSFCHGRDATGGESGPDLTRSKLVAADVNGEKIAVFQTKECQLLIARTSKSQAWLLSFTRSKPCLLKVAAREQGDEREWTRRICKPGAWQLERNISKAPAVASAVIRRPEIFQVSLRGIRDWN
jgi:hypothetical protein